MSTSTFPAEIVEDLVTMQDWSAISLEIHDRQRAKCKYSRNQISELADMMRSLIAHYETMLSRTLRWIELSSKIHEQYKMRKKFAKHPLSKLCDKMHILVTHYEDRLCVAAVSNDGGADNDCDNAVPTVDVTSLDDQSPSFASQPQHVSIFLDVNPSGVIVVRIDVVDVESSDSSAGHWSSSSDSDFNSSDSDDKYDYHTDDSSDACTGDEDEGSVD